MDDLNSGNLDNNSQTKTDKLFVTKYVGLPSSANAINKESNLRYDSSTKKYQYYDGSSWITFDVSGPPSNLWTVDSTTYIKPLSTYTSGIKVSDITPITGTTLIVHGDITSNETFKLKDTTTPTKMIQMSYNNGGDYGEIQAIDTAGPTAKSLYLENGGGTVFMPYARIITQLLIQDGANISAYKSSGNSDLNLYGQGTGQIVLNSNAKVSVINAFTGTDITFNNSLTGGFVFNLTDSTLGSSAFKVMWPSANGGQPMESYFGRDTNYNTERRYFYNSDVATSYSADYFNFNGYYTGIKMYKDSVKVHADLTAGTAVSFRVGGYLNTDAIELAYNQGTTTANSYLTMNALGYSATPTLRINGDGTSVANIGTVTSNNVYVDNVYEKTSSAGIKFNQKAICSGGLYVDNVYPKTAGAEIVFDSTIRVKSTASGEWEFAVFGNTSSTAGAVVMGSDTAGTATIAGHKGDLSDWAELNINRYWGGATFDGSDVNISKNGKTVRIYGAILLPNYTTAPTAAEGFFGYDYTNHLLMYYNGSAWKSVTGVTYGGTDVQKLNLGPDFKKSENDDINIKKLRVDEISSRGGKGVVINELRVGANKSKEPGTFGYDDLGAYVVTKNDMKYYFAPCEKRNNDYGVDNKVYDYCSERFKKLLKRIDVLEKQMVVVTSAFKELQKKYIDEKSKRLEEEFEDKDGFLSNSLNFIGK